MFYADTIGLLLVELSTCCEMELVMMCARYSAIGAEAEHSKDMVTIYIASNYPPDAAVE
jgi:hypothetical protein